MNTLTKTKKDVEQLSESVINEEWESWDEYCDDYIEDLTKKYDDFISSFFKSFSETASRLTR